MRSLILALVLAGGTLAAAPALASHGLHLSDGITARITFLHGDGVMLQPSSDGYVGLYVHIYQNGPSGWAGAQVASTLRVWSYDPATNAETDRVSIPFQPSSAGVAYVAFQASDVPANQPLDVFITFSALGGNPVPTSHHNVAKNEAIDARDFASADALDPYGTRVGIAG